MAADSKSENSLRSFPQLVEFSVEYNLEKTFATVIDLLQLVCAVLIDIKLLE